MGKVRLSSLDLSNNKVSSQGASLARTMAQRFAEFVNVLDDGVVYDGVTDNSAAIAKAVARLPVNGTLYFPPGSNKCLISSPINLPANCTLYAMPGTVTVAPTSSHSSSPMLLTIANRQNVRVSGIIFDGGGSTFSNASTVTQVFNSSNVVFDQCQVQNTRGIGTLFSICSKCGVRNSRYINVGNYYKTTNQTSDQKQSIAFSSGVSLVTSAAQGSPGNTLTFSSTAGVSAGFLLSAGNGILPGTRVQSVTATTVTLTVSTYAAVASGLSISFTNNVGNFVNSCYFEDVGLDPISASGQTDFVSSNNILRGIGGPYNFGLGGGLYIVNCDGVVLQGNSINVAGGNGIDIYKCNNLLVIGNSSSLAGISGIGVASVTNATLCGNVCLNNNKNLTSTANANTIGQTGILLSGINGDPASDNVTITGNICSDTQASKSQSFGIQQLSVATFNRLWVDQSNQITGNASADFGGTATGYALAKIANTINGIQQFGTSPNFGLALLPTGTGAISTSVPDNTIANGNARGLNALDLQSSRSASTQVASGQYSSILGGRNNTASGQYGTVVGGTFCNADGGFSVVLSGYASARQTSGKVVLGSSALLQAVGGIQSANLMLQATTTDGTTAKRLTSDASATAGQGNIGQLPNNGAYRMRTTVTVIDVTTANASTNDTCVWDIDLVMQRGNGAATTRIVPGAGGTGSSLTITQRACDPGLTSLASPTVTADTTFGGPSVIATGQASKTLHWVQGVWTIEAQ